MASLEDKKAFFNTRTLDHITRVRINSERIVKFYPEFSELIEIASRHDASKFEEPEYTPYLELTWNKFKGIKDVDSRTTEATLFHVKNNEHHPEFWNKEKANLDPNDRDKSIKCLEAFDMSDLAIAEMVCDWQAMSDELKENTAREWYNKQNNVRWCWTKEQNKLIDKLLKVFEDMKFDRSSLGAWKIEDGKVVECVTKEEYRKRTIEGWIKEDLERDKYVTEAKWSKSNAGTVYGLGDYLVEESTVGNKHWRVLDKDNTLIREFATLDLAKVYVEGLCKKDGIKLDEGWKEILGTAAVAGALLTGAPHADAKVDKAPTQEVHHSGNKAQRNNNPVNIRDEHNTTDWKGEIGRDSGGFCKFIDVAHGFRAGVRNLRTNQKKNPNMSLEKYLLKFANTSPRNEQIAYIDYVAKGLGVDKHTPIAKLDLFKTVALQADIESGHKIKFTSELQSQVRRIL